MLGPTQEPKAQVKPGCAGDGTGTSQNFSAQTAVPQLSFWFFLAQD